MEITKVAEGKLKMDVSSEGNYIPSRTSVVVERVVDDCKNIYYKVVSMRTNVKLSYYDTNVQDLVQ